MKNLLLITCPRCGYMIHGRVWRCPGCGGIGMNESDKPEKNRESHQGLRRMLVAVFPRRR